jgi:hypothetical protein
MGWLNDAIVTTTAGVIGGGLVAAVNQWADHRRAVKVETQREEREADRDRLRDQQGVDTAILSATRALITEDDIDWLRRCDFGGAWRSANERPLAAYCEVARQSGWSLTDPELERLRTTFADALIAWLHAVSYHGGYFDGHRGYSTPNGHQYREYWGDNLSGEEAQGHAIWVKAQSAINETSVAAAAAWEPFMTTARRTLPSAFAAPMIPSIRRDEDDD